jgi:hypothetical protein
VHGKSGRIVLEIDPSTKRRLYSKLASEGLTLKGWFVEKAEAYLADDDAVQLQLKPLGPQPRTETAD